MRLLTLSKPFDFHWLHALAVFVMLAAFSAGTLAEPPPWAPAHGYRNKHQNDDWDRRRHGDRDDRRHSDWDRRHHDDRDDHRHSDWDRRRYDDRDGHRHSDWDRRREDDWDERRHSDWDRRRYDDRDERRRTGDMLDEGYSRLRELIAPTD